jgi:hypothetical protein
MALRIPAVYVAQSWFFETEKTGNFTDVAITLNVNSPKISLRTKSSNTSKAKERTSYGKHPKEKSGRQSRF